MPGHQIRFVGLDARRLRPGRRRAATEPASQLVNDRRGDVVLHGEHIGELTVIAIRPQLTAVTGADQLRRDPDPVPRPAHAALENRVHSEGVGNPADRHVLPFEGKRRRPRDDFQSRHPRQRVDDLLRQAVAEILLLAIRAQVRKWQHRDRRDVGAGRRGFLERQPQFGRALIPARRRFLQAAPDDAGERFGRLQRRGVVTQNRRQRLGR